MAGRSFHEKSEALFTILSRNARQLCRALCNLLNADKFPVTFQAQMWELRYSLGYRCEEQREMMKSKNTTMERRGLKGRALSAF